MIPTRIPAPTCADSIERSSATLYPWAGEIRTVGIAKTDPFCPPQHIETYAAGVFGSLADASARIAAGEVRRSLGHYFAEINAIHPFREGNGRAQRAFVHQFCREAGHPGDDEPLRRMLDALVTG